MGARRIILLADDVRVVRASEIAAMMDGKTVRQVAAELGVAHSNVHRILKGSGYATTRGGE